MDSYQNLLFALARFKEVTSQYPSRVTVVGYGMKRARWVTVQPVTLLTSRFDHLHRAAISYPRDNFTYVGIDDEGDVTPHYAGEASDCLTVSSTGLTRTSSSSTAFSPSYPRHQAVIHPCR